MGTYAKAFEIPEDFPAILREFAKEAIREQPTDIYRWVWSAWCTTVTLVNTVLPKNEADAEIDCSHSI